jgi:hypothetical protein
MRCVLAWMGLLCLVQRTTGDQDAAQAAALAQATAKAHLVAQAEAQAQAAAQALAHPLLFTAEVNIDNATVSIPVRDGESPGEVARRVGAEHGLAKEGVTSLVQILTRKAMDVLGQSAVKRVFFELPVRVRIPPCTASISRMA